MQAFNLNDPEFGKHALIVIGMHRSGTSATTGALQCLGVQLGKKLYAGHSNINPKGYFEHNDITDLNDDVLLQLGSCWDDVLVKEEGWEAEEELRPFAARMLRYMHKDFAQSPLWAIKDPRVCRLLPWWLGILATAGVKPHFLFVIRSPDEVYRSLHRRDGFSQEKAFMLWVLHYLEAERATRDCTRAFLPFDSLLNNPAEELLRVERQLNLRFPVPVEAAAECLRRFLSNDLKHHRSGGDRSSEIPIVGLAYALEANLLQAARHPEIEPNRAAMDELWRRLEEIQASLSPLLVQQLRALNRDRGQTQLTFNRVMRSWYWYMGKPARFLERLLGRNV